MFTAADRTLSCVRVEAARQRQRQRFAQVANTHCNAEMESAGVRQHCRPLDQPAATLLRAAMERLGLSARAHDRILKVSRTIADLAASERIHVEHVAEAVQYRCLDRPALAPLRSSRQASG